MKRLGFVLAFLVMMVSTVSSAEDASSSVNQAQYQELTHLSKTYKSHLADLEKMLNESNETVVKLRDENIALTHDLTQVQADLKEEIATMKKDQDQKNFWLMIGVAGAAVFGLLAH